jgi:G3E family GTPase
MVSAANKLTKLTVVAGGSYAEREAWITTALQNLSSDFSDDNQKHGVLLEGLPTGSMSLQTSSQLRVERIAPGCFCCIGQIAMRVTLTRLLRQQLSHLFIAMNELEHLPALQASLSSSVYASFLHLENEIIL